MKKWLIGLGVGVVVCVIWLGVPFFVPQHVTATSADVTEIRLFNGDTGEARSITDEALIDAFLNEAAQAEYVREKIAYGLGYTLRVTYMDGDKEVDEYLLDENGTVRQSIFVYGVKEQPFLAQQAWDYGQ